MSLRQIVQEALADIVRVIETPDGIKLVTLTMYPSGSFVTVKIRGGTDTFTVSDERGALREIEAAGAEIERADRLLRGIAANHGLQISKGEISSSTVNRQSLGLAISLVAEASRAASEWLFDHTKIERPRNFRAMLKRLLEVSFADRLTHDSLLGQSNKPHKFEHIIRLPGGKRIVVDPVLNDVSSINARVVAHMDVRLAGHEGLEQRLVYDDEEKWTPENLNLLHVGAPVVLPFSKAPDVFGRIAHAVQ